MLRSIHPHPLTKNNHSGIVKGLTVLGDDRLDLVTNTNMSNLLAKIVTEACHAGIPIVRMMLVLLGAPDIPAVLSMIATPVQRPASLSCYEEGVGCK